MSLYYEDDHVTLYHGDCRDLVNWRRADVMVTDPPYGTAGDVKRGADGYGRRKRSERGEQRIASGQGIANDRDTTCRDSVLNGWGERPALVFGSPRLADPPGTWEDRLVWDKGQMGLNGGPWRYQHESIYVRGFRRVSDGDSSILRSIDQRGSGAWRPHPHFKPIGLIEHLVERAPDGVIVDPFAGSGTTLIAARNLGRKAIGVEIEEKYCQLIAARLSQQAFDFTALEVR
jgi:site-specific DNA-methyltransferase (adenine-specific)